MSIWVVLVATFLIMLLAAAAMAVGVAISKKPLRGSCGGTIEACECLRLNRTPPEHCSRTSGPVPTGHARLPVHPPQDEP